MTKPVDDAAGPAATPPPSQKPSVKFEHFTADGAQAELPPTMSTWLGVAVLILTAFVMQDSFHGLLILGIIAVLLFLMRWVAHLEGPTQ